MLTRGGNIRQSRCGPVIFTRRILLAAVGWLDQSAGEGTRRCLKHLDALLLARLQFAFIIGLASYLFVLNALWLTTRRQVYEVLFDFWKTIFAEAFGMGIVMSYQFGANWSRFADTAYAHRVFRGKVRPEEGYHW